MRRLLGDAVLHTTRVWHDLKSGLDGFFFAPADPTALGLIRIITGLLAFWSLFVLGLDLEAYLGRGSWASADLVWHAQRPLQWSIWFLVPDALLRPAWVACLGVLALFAAGAFSRVTAVLAWVIIVSTVRRSPASVFGFDQVLSMLLFYLAVTGASGQSVSFDRFWKRWRQARAITLARPPRYRPDGLGRQVEPTIPGKPRPSISANLTIRLIQLHLALIYATAGLAKLQGVSWWNGEATWRIIAAGEFVGFNLTALARWPNLLAALTHLSLALELLYPVLIWPWRTRPFVLLGVVALHAGIGIVNPGLAEFGVAMLGANLAFVSGRYLRSLATASEQPALRVLFDGACPRCRGWMALLAASDPDQILEPVDLTAVDVRKIHPTLTPEACMEAMHVVDTQGRVASGFDAFRTIAGWLPLYWPFAAFGHVPGVAVVGRIGYNRIAASRPRDVACNDDVCGIHSRPSPKPLRDRGGPHPPKSTSSTQEDPLRRRAADD